MSWITIGSSDGATDAAQSSASVRVIDSGARAPNSARNALSWLRAVSMLEAL